MAGGTDLAPAPDLDRFFFFSKNISRDPKITNFLRPGNPTFFNTEEFELTSTY